MTNENVTLPLLPLKSGVVLPGMVFTMALESDEARAAVESARTAGGRLLLVPHIEGRFARVGVIAEVMEEGDLPGGLPAVALRGDGRATIGTGVPGTGDALWVEAEPVVEPEATAAANELAREYRAVLENILLSRGAGRIARPPLVPLLHRPPLRQVAVDRVVRGGLIGHRIGPDAAFEQGVQHIDDVAEQRD